MFLDICSANKLPSVMPKVFLKGFIPLQQSAAMMIYAFGGVGKSFLSIRIAYEYIIENPRAKVALWLTEDSPAENKRRASKICEDMGITDSENVQFINDSPKKLTKLSDGNAVLTDDFYKVRASLNEFDLVVLDPLLQFQGCDENSNTHAGVLMGAFKEWAAEELKTILLLHHATPQEGELPNGVKRLKPRGAGEWVNGTRGAYQLNKLATSTIPEEESRRTLRATLTKDNGISFYVRDDMGNLHRDLLVFPEHKKQKQAPQVPFLSIANHNSAKNPRGYKKIDVYFRDIHNYVIGNQAYSPYSFKDEYRLGENNEGGATILCFDFDGGLTIEGAKKFFFKYECLIVTTKSHQKQKGDEKPLDRFRVFLNLRQPLDIPTTEYSEFLDYLFGIIKHVDPSTKDLARFYFASPLESEYWYSQSSVRFDWVPVYEKMKRSTALKKVQEKITNESKKEIKLYEGKELENTLPESQIFTTKTGEKTFVQFRNTLEVGMKEQVKCIEGIDHAGLGADHFSAFVQKWTNGNVFYHCKGGRCGETLWCANFKGE